MRSFFLLSIVNSALPPPQRRLNQKQELFGGLVLEPHRRWPAFAYSAVLHLVLLALVPPAAKQFSGPSEEEQWARHTRVLRTLRLRIPEQLYIASAGPAAPKPPVVYRKASGAAAPGASPSAAPRQRRRRRVDLPALPRNARSDQSILQPHYEASLSPSGELQLPDVFFWAPELAPNDMARAFLQPGHAAPPTAARLMDTTPKLELPVPYPGTEIMAGLPTALVAALANPPSLPVQTSDPRLLTRDGVPADPLPGDPTAVLSMSDSSMPLREFLNVPPGNQVGLTAGLDGLLGGTASADSNGPAGKGRGGGSGAAGNGNGRGTGNSAGNGSPETAVASSATSREGSGNGSGDPMTASRAAALAAAEATRINHPAGGVFDVIVQSSSVDGFAESAGVLSGQPVYSVYLQVGGPKDWILQYCIPAGDSQLQTSGPVIRLPKLSPVSAPYPRVTMRPVIYRRAGTYLMLHGYITAEGRFEDLTVLSTGDPEEHANVMAILERWQFRPAMQQDNPVRVEVLVAIPSEIPR